MGAAGLIGRDAPRARLADAAARAADGLGSLVLVAGPAGIGKTALLDDVLAGSALTAVRATAPAGGSQAWGPVVAALRAARRRDPASIAVPATAGAAPRAAAPGDGRRRGRERPRDGRRGRARRVRHAGGDRPDGRGARRPAVGRPRDVRAPARAGRRERRPAAARARGLPLGGARARASAARRPPRPAARRRAARGGAAAARSGRHPGAGGARARRARGRAVAVRLHARSGGVPFAVLELAAAIAGGADADAPLPETCARRC